MASEEMVVSTGKGERANITLPDGTAVALNSESSLTYTPRVFNKDKRQIRFEGEGYFQVAKNRDCPFLIDAEGLSVEVLGTTFNLDVRRSRKTAELILEEGSVRFHSLKIGKDALLEPKEKLILDQETGHFVIEKGQDIESETAWKRRELVFDDVMFDLTHLRYNYYRRLCRLYNTQLNREEFIRNIGSSRIMFKDSPIDHALLTTEALIDKIETDLYRQKLREEIEAVLREYFDRHGSDFGQPVPYGTIYGIIDVMKHVTRVRSISLDARGSGIRRNRTGDILLPVNGLAYLKEWDCMISSAG